MSYVPSQDQVMASLRVLIPCIGTALTAFGLSQAEAGSYTQMGVAMIGPLSLLIVGIWTLLANTRESIMRKASQPVAPGAPAPQIVLPKQEAALADKLPNNVTAAS